MSRLWKGLADMLRDPSVHDVYFVVNNLHYLPSRAPKHPRVPPQCLGDPDRREASMILFGTRCAGCSSAGAANI